MRALQCSGHTRVLRVLTQDTVYRSHNLPIASQNPRPKSLSQNHNLSAYYHKVSIESLRVIDSLSAVKTDFLDITFRNLEIKKFGIIVFLHFDHKVAENQIK